VALTARQVLAQDLRGAVESQHCPPPSGENGEKQLVVDPSLAPRYLENSPRTAIPGAVTNQFLDLGAAETRGVGLPNAEHSVLDGEIRVGFEHPRTMAEPGASPGWTCG
jgi:hypothetical protein